MLVNTILQSYVPIACQLNRSHNGKSSLPNMDFTVEISGT